jgi:hypothetical protein
VTYHRKSLPFLGFLAVGAVLGLFVLAHAVYSQSASRARLERTRQLVQRLGLTDLCLFTDARYTRHPAMADLHSAFQDYPLSFEHFPSGSLVPPPPHLTGHEVAP